ncbi:MAG TPA: CoA pyrophosphatase [Kofleriaceae bacterium]|nr:CoA pyrophosphatase [Kofleriaceae bacterium]
MTELLQRMITRVTPARPVPDPAHVARCAAVSVIVRAIDGAPHTLLLKRAEREGDPWSGQIALPGGRFERSDADLYTTALRETHEETAVDLRGSPYHGHAEALHPFSAGPKGMPVTPFLFSLEHEPQIALSAEATTWFWFPLHLAADGKLNSSISFRNNTFPSWQFGEHAVWGLTMRILAQFIAR